jgi:hypothetical protein
MAIPAQSDATRQVCPDPSAHEHSHQARKPQHHAAGAALYNPQSSQQTSKRDSNYPLDKNGKLSSAGRLPVQLGAFAYLTMT